MLSVLHGYKGLNRFSAEECGIKGVRLHDTSQPASVRVRVSVIRAAVSDSEFVVDQLLVKSKTRRRRPPVKTFGIGRASYAQRPLVRNRAELNRFD